MNFTFFVSRRYLFSRKSHNAINIVTGISVSCVAVVTAALIIIISAMNGLSDLVESLYNSFHADVRITAVKGKTFVLDAEDVAAMKLNAISNRGCKKDFYDVAALLDHLPLPSMIGHYQAKYRPASLMMVIRSLSWFEDADLEPDPISLCGETWPAIVDKVSAAIRSLE